MKEDSTSIPGVASINGIRKRITLEKEQSLVGIMMDIEHGWVEQH